MITYISIIALRIAIRFAMQKKRDKEGEKIVTVTTYSKLQSKLQEA